MANDKETASLQLSEFKKFFSGNDKNYGLHTYKFANEKEKEQGSNITVTNKLITIDEYRDHLNGKAGLGIIPIMEDNTCNFSVIDVDIYDIDFTTYLEAIESNNLPLVPFRSKSGGLHIYLFFIEPAPAKDAIDVTREYSTILGLDMLVKQRNNKTLEVYPKQRKLGGNAVGSWINLPYFNAKDTKQYAIRNGKPLSLEDALLYIRGKVIDVKSTKEYLKEAPYNDAPPCLQTLYFLNPLGKESGRNNYLFSFGVYLKKKDENFYEQHIYELNRGLRDPLPEEEVEKTIISSLRRKEYSYKCFENPCLGYCNKTRCKEREFGVGREDGYFSDLVYGKLYQIQTNSPYYEWEVKLQNDEDFKRLRFKNEDEIIQQNAFLRLCFRQLYRLPVKLKQSEWFKIINQHLLEIEKIVVEEEDDLSPMVMFKSIFFEFLFDRAKARTKEQILDKRVYYDQDEGFYAFRIKDLLNYLFQQKMFKEFTTQEIHGILRDIGVTSKLMHLKDCSIRVAVLTKEQIKIVEKMKNKEFEPVFEQFDEKAF